MPTASPYRTLTTILSGLGRGFHAACASPARPKTYRDVQMQQAHKILSRNGRLLTTIYLSGLTQDGCVFSLIQQDLDPKQLRPSNRRYH